MTMLKCIMLIDDNKIDNFFHERVIMRNNAAETVIAFESAIEALEHIKKGDSVLQPEIIFLDINMPVMNGWQFIEQFKQLDVQYQKAMIVVMLTASQDPDDRAFALTQGVLSDFKNKPLTAEMLTEVLEKYRKHKSV